MKTTASKENPTSSNSSNSFFSKKEEVGFFGQTKETEQPFFQPRQQPVIQTKLTINKPGDQYEQEADIMADRVMRMSEVPSREAGIIQTKPLPISFIQRKCATCEEKEKVQRQEMDEEGTLQTKHLMRKAEGGGYTASPQLATQLNSSKGGGDPLPGQMLASMNHVFETNFSSVRIHTGSQAAEMSQGIQAKAFTHGSDIYFNQGQYSPESSEGKRLLGHELTHVVQQGEGRVKKQGSESIAKMTTRSPAVQRSCPLTGSERTQLKMHGDETQRPTPLGCLFDAHFSTNDGQFNFLQGSSDVSSLMQPLDAFKKRWHSSGANSNIILHGFASVEGCEDRNWILSCNRALNVRNALVQPCLDGSPGVSSNFITIFAQGETNQFSMTNPDENRVVKITSIVPIIPPPIPSCHMLKIWINAFIPQTVSGYTYSIPAGALSGSTAIPCPLIGTPVNPNCPFVGYATDQRTFDNSIPRSSSSPSVRMRSIANIDLVALNLAQAHQTSGTTEVVRNAHLGLVPGDITCVQNADMSNCAFVNHLDGSNINHSSVFSLGSLDVSGAASDPCVRLAADIDYTGEIKISINPVSNIVIIDFAGKLDEFPAFEMYAEMNGTVKEILREPPPSGNTVADLLGGANRAKSGHVEFSCAYPTANHSE